MKESNFLRITEKYRDIINGDRAVLVNRDTGEWMRISKECYDILIKAVRERYNIEDLIACLADAEDKEFLEKL